MTIITIISQLTHRYLLGKTKDELARWALADNARLTQLYRNVLMYGRHADGCSSETCSCGFDLVKRHAEQWLGPYGRGDAPAVPDHHLERIFIQRGAGILEGGLLQVRDEVRGWLAQGANDAGYVNMIPKPTETMLRAWIEILDSAADVAREMRK